MGRVYAVASGKGGVGKTTTVANLGTALATAGHDVAVVDCDLAMANLGPALGVDRTGTTLHDVLAGTAPLDAAVHEGPRGLAVVPGATDLAAFARADPDRLSSVLATLRERHDFVLVDTGAGLNTDNVAPLSVADAVLLVSTPDRPALGLRPTDLGVSFDTLNFAFQPRTSVMIFSDGFSESLNLGGEEFGLERLEELWRERERSPEDVRDLLIEASRTFSEGHPQNDDRTLLVVSRQRQPES